MDDLVGWVSPVADLRESFELICAETGDRLAVRGEMFIVSEGSA